MFDKGVSFVSLLIGIGVVYVSSRFPEPIFAGQMGPGVFPSGIGYLIILVSILLFIEASRKKPESFSPLDRNLFWSILIIALYVIFMEPLGFIVASFLLIFGIGYMLGARKYLTLSMIGLLFPGAIYFMFTALGIMLPKGILPI